MPISKTRMDALEALHRAQSGTSVANDVLVIESFMARGIPEEEIEPRENVLTFNAWIAKGRVVKKGEKSVRVPTLIPARNKETKEIIPGKDGKPRMIRWTSFVFHISQTQEIAEKEKAA